MDGSAQQRHGLAPWQIKIGSSFASLNAYTTEDTHTMKKVFSVYISVLCFQGLVNLALQALDCCIYSFIIDFFFLFVRK